MVVTLLGMMIEDKGQPKNADACISNTPSGILMEVSFEQLPKEYSSMTVKLVGMLIEASLLHPLNANLPILITLLGTTAEVRFVHPLHAYSNVQEAIRESDGSQSCLVRIKGTVCYSNSSRLDCYLIGRHRTFIIE